MYIVMKSRLDEATLGARRLDAHEHGLEHVQWKAHVMAMAI